MTDKFSDFSVTKMTDLIGYDDTYQLAVISLIIVSKKLYFGKQ